MESPKIVDVKDNLEVLNAINEIINVGGIAEVKLERHGLSVVEIKRKLKVPNKSK